VLGARQAYQSQLALDSPRGVVEIPRGVDDVGRFASGCRVSRERGHRPSNLSAGAVRPLRDSRVAFRFRRSYVKRLMVIVRLGAPIASRVAAAATSYSPQRRSRRHPLWLRRDVVVSDRVDRVGSDCERVRRR
jgi:hypothetical protein